MVNPACGSRTPPREGCRPRPRPHRNPGRLLQQEGRVEAGAPFAGEDHIQMHAVQADLRRRSVLREAAAIDPVAQALAAVCGEEDSRLHKNPLSRGSLAHRSTNAAGLPTNRRPPAVRARERAT